MIDVNKAERIRLEEAKEIVSSIGATARARYSRALRGGDLAECATKHESKIAEWPGMTREIFGRLSDPDGCKDLAEDKKSKWGTRAINALEGMPDWPLMQESCAAHGAIAARATEEISHILAAHLGVDAMSEKGAAEPESNLAQAESLKRLIEEIEAEGEARAEAEGEIKDLLHEAALGMASRSLLEQAAEQAAGGRAMAQALAGAAEAAAKSAEAVRIIRGCGLEADLSSGSEEVSTEILDLVSSDPLLLEILRELGRMHEAVRAAGEADGPDGCAEVVGVELGGDVSRLIGSEIACLVSRPLRIDLFARLADEAAFCWEYKGEAEADRGDLLLVVDRSGSMRGSRISFARAIALFMAQRARKEGRRVVLTMFAGEGDTETITITRPQDMREAIRLISLSPKGGTDLDGALRKSAAAFSDLRDPDTMIITDGRIRDVQAGTVERLKRGGASIRAILLGDATSAPVDFADRAWSVNGNGDAAQAASILREVKRGEGR